MRSLFGRFIRRILPVLLLVVLIVMVSAVAVSASAGTAPPPTLGIDQTSAVQVLTVDAAPQIPPDLWSWVVDLFLVQWPSLVGVAALITVLVNVGKTVGWVPDSTAPKWSAGLNLLGMIALIALKIFKPMLTVEAIDAQAGLIASVFLVVSGYALMIITSRQTHVSLAGVPVIGKSFSFDAKE